MSSLWHPQDPPDIMVDLEKIRDEKAQGKDMNYVGEFSMKRHKNSENSQSLIISFLCPSSF